MRPMHRRFGKSMKAIDLPTADAARAVFAVGAIMAATFGILVAAFALHL